MSEPQPMPAGAADGDAAGAIHPQPPTPTAPKRDKKRSQLKGGLDFDFWNKKL